MWEIGWERLLQVSALVLSVINGLILVRVRIRDRARLKVAPIHPDTYQWWFRLPDATFQGRTTRLFGFLGYIAVLNRGYRAVSINGWRLRIGAKNHQYAELRAFSIPEPTYNMGEHLKVFPVLGQKGLIHQGEVRIDSGDSTGGMAFYVYECFGSDSWDPLVRDGKIKGRYTVRDVFGGKAKCQVIFREKTLEDVEAMIPSLRDIVQTIHTDRGTTAR